MQEFQTHCNYYIYCMKLYGNAVPPHPAPSLFLFLRSFFALHIIKDCSSDLLLTSPAPCLHHYPSEPSALLDHMTTPIDCEKRWTPPICPPLSELWHHQSLPARLLRIWQWPLESIFLPGRAGEGCPFSYAWETCVWAVPQSGSVSSEFEIFTTKSQVHIANPLGFLGQPRKGWNKISCLEQETSKVLSSPRILWFYSKWPLQVRLYEIWRKYISGNAHLTIVIGTRTCLAKQCSHIDCAT